MVNLIFPQIVSCRPQQRTASHKRPKMSYFVRSDQLTGAVEHCTSYLDHLGYRLVHSNPVFTRPSTITAIMKQQYVIQIFCQEMGEVRGGDVSELLINRRFILRKRKIYSVECRVSRFCSLLIFCLLSCLVLMLPLKRGIKIYSLAFHCCCSVMSRIKFGKSSRFYFQPHL